jgi:hypothetical protein
VFSDGGFIFKTPKPNFWSISAHIQDTSAVISGGE